MPLYSKTTTLDNSLDKTGEMVLREHSTQIKKLFGIVIQKAVYIRNTEKLDIDIVENKQLLGFNVNK